MEERLEETSQQSEEPSAAETQAFDEDRLVGILESVLFASGEPIALKRLVEILDGPTPAEVRGALRSVSERLESSGRGVRLTEVAGGYQLRTARENAEWVRAVFRDKPRKLGRAALETLAVIAYRQPITRAEIEAIRGVDIEAVLTTLLQRSLAKVVGRKETVGRPILYGTSEVFLELFGFRDLSELPTLKELPQGAEVNPNEQAEDGGQRFVAAEGDIPQPGGDEAPPSIALGDASPAPADDAPRTGAPAEAAQPGGDHLAAEGGGADRRGPGPAERPGGTGAGNAGGPNP